MAFIADLIAYSTCFGLRVMCPVCGLQPANRTHNPQLHTIPTTWKPKHQIPQAATTCIILWSSWWWADWCPKHVEQAKRSAIKTICCIYLAINFYRVFTSSCPWAPLTSRAIYRIWNLQPPGTLNIRFSQKLNSLNSPKFLLPQAACSTKLRRSQTRYNRQ